MTGKKAKGIVAGEGVIDKPDIADIRRANLVKARAARAKKRFDISKIPEQIIMQHGGIPGFVAWMLERYPKEAIKLVSKAVAQKGMKIVDASVTNDNRIVVNVVQYHDSMAAGQPAEIPTLINTAGELTDADGDEGG